MLMHYVLISKSKFILFTIIIPDLDLFCICLAALKYIYLINNDRNNTETVSGETKANSN